MYRNVLEELKCLEIAFSEVTSAIHLTHDRAGVEATSFRCLTFERRDFSREEAPAERILVVSSTYDRKLARTYARGLYITTLMPYLRQQGTNSGSISRVMALYILCGDRG